MSNHDAGQYKTPLMIFAAVVAIYGIFGWLDVSNYAQGGWNTDGNNTVTEVLPGSPAEAGGLMVGDFIVSDGGIATSDTEAQLRRGRPKIGETWEFIVERDGETRSLNVTFGEPVAQRKLIAHAGFLVGFCFIGFTLWAYLQKQTASTSALAIAGTLGSLIFIAGPYFENYTLRISVLAIVNILLFLGVASILNFLLVHFRSKSNRLIYLPGLAAGLFIAYIVVAVPESSSAMNTFTTIFLGVIVAFYLIAALVTIYRGYSSASPQDRASQGLNLMLIGALIGLVPSIIATVTAIFAPQVVLPGVNFYFLTLVALPITWSVAVLKGAAD